MPLHFQVIFEPHITDRYLITLPIARLRTVSFRTGLALQVPQAVVQVLDHVVHVLNLPDVRGHEGVGVAVPAAEDHLSLPQLSPLTQRELRVTFAFLFPLDLTQLCAELIVPETHVGKLACMHAFAVQELNNYTFLPSVINISMLSCLKLTCTLLLSKN